MPVAPAEHMEEHFSRVPHEGPGEKEKAAVDVVADGCSREDVVAVVQGEGEDEEEMTTLPIWPPSQLAREAVVQGEGEDEEEMTTLPIWPPSQLAREAVIQSLAESLSSPSTLFEKYGPVPLEEAAAAASRIEQEAFAAVSLPASPAGTGGDEKSEGVDEDDGMETLNAYSKEISKRVMDFCQSRKAASSPPAPALPADSPHSPTAPTSEEAPLTKSEVSRA